jgi:hypothetical protein
MGRRTSDDSSGLGVIADEWAQTVEAYQRSVEGYFERIRAESDAVRCEANAAVWGGARCIMRCGHGTAHHDGQKTKFFASA